MPSGAPLPTQIKAPPPSILTGQQELARLAMPSLFHQRAPQVKNKKHEDRRGEGRGGRRLSGEKAAERVDVGWEMVTIGAVPRRRTVNSRRRAVASLRRQLRRRLAPSRRLAGTPGFESHTNERGQQDTKQQQHTVLWSSWHGWACSWRAELH